MAFLLTILTMDTMKEKSSTKDADTQLGRQQVTAVLGTKAVSPVRISDTQSQLLVTPAPLKIEVDSSTDWVAVLLTPLALAIAAGIFAARTNRQQIRSSTANFRHTWQLDLRNVLVSYLGAIKQLSIKASVNPRYPLSDEAEMLRTQLLTAQATVALMLDPQKQYAKNLKAAMAETGSAIFNVPPDVDSTLVGMEKVIAAAQVALESAWQDIRRDLHHDPSDRS